MVALANTPISHEEAARLKSEDEKRRRLQRLREVRQQEARIAAETRQSFKRVAKQHAGKLLNAAEELWQVRQAAAVERAGKHVESVLSGVGAAHVAADAVRRAQESEAIAGVALWKRGLASDRIRQQRASLEVQTTVADKEWQAEAAKARRGYVSLVEGKRAQAAAQAAQAAAQTAEENAKTEALAKALAEAAVPRTASRTKTRVSHAAGVDGCVEGKGARRGLFKGKADQAGGPATRMSPADAARAYVIASIQRHVALTPAEDATAVATAWESTPLTPARCLPPSAAAEAAAVARRAAAAKEARRPRAPRRRAARQH